MEGLMYPNSIVSYRNHTIFSNRITPSPYHLHSWDYVIFSFAFLLPVLVSSIFGFFERNRKSSEEYLIGRREMSVFPVSLSLFSGFISGVTILGNPVEIYLYGTQIWVMILTLLPVVFMLVHFYLPVYFNMELNSPFEYFERRFSRTTRILVSIVSLAQMMIYMTLVVHFTTIVSSKVIGIDGNILTAVTIVVTVYSSYLGGYRGTTWTNALQVLILIGSLLTAVVLGLLSISQDFKIQWNHVIVENRFQIFNFDPDPSARSTVWTSSIGGYFVWISFYGGAQTQIQRFISLPNLRTAKRAAYLNISYLVILLSICFVLGLLVFANYFGCDPVKIGTVDSFIELVPKYIENLYKGHVGLYGFFLAGILCASLSTVMSCLNSMSCLLTLDYFKHWVPNISEERLIFLSKIMNVFLGGLSFALVIVAQNIEQFLPLLWEIVGMSFGPMLGIFSLGIFFPWANSKGSIVGMLSTLILLITAITFSNIPTNMDEIGYISPNQRLPLVITESCLEKMILLRNRNNSFEGSNNLSSLLTQYNEKELIISSKNPWIPTIKSIISWNKNQNDVIEEEIFRISYLWYPAIGCVGTVFFGLLFSLLFIKFQKKLTVSPECFSPPILRLWLKWFPSHMCKWIEPDENLMLLSYSAFSFLPRGSEKINRKYKEPKCDVEITPVY